MHSPGELPPFLLSSLHPSLSFSPSPFCYFPTNTAAEASALTVSLLPLQTRQRALTLTNLHHLSHLHWRPELRGKTDFCSPSVCGIVRHIVGRRYIWRCHWGRGNFRAGLHSPCPSAATSNTVVPVPPKVTFSASDTSLLGQSATLENGTEMISECVEHSKIWFLELSYIHNEYV